MLWPITVDPEGQHYDSIKGQCVCFHQISVNYMSGNSKIQCVYVIYIYIYINNQLFKCSVLPKTKQNKKKNKNSKAH